MKLRKRWHFELIWNSIMCLMVFAVLVAGVTYGIIAFNHKSTYTVTVTEKYIKRSDKQDVYMINSEDNNGNIKIFQNRDSLLGGKFNSSDIQAEIKVGKKYKVVAYGFRIHLLSKYENILSVKEGE